MIHEDTVLERIKQLAISRKYRIKIHAIRHMIEEGFTEENVLESINKGCILENYADEYRCLIVGSFHFTEKTTSPLHVICDYSNYNLIDIVTAYIPQKPWWLTPTKRGKIS